MTEATLSILYAIEGRVHRAHLVRGEEGVRLRYFNGDLVEPRQSLVLLIPILILRVPNSDEACAQ